MANPLVLIVEDNARNAKLLRDVLQASGYRTLETETGEEGVAIARREHPELIVMDIHLPGMDGKAALRELRGDPLTRGIPVIAVTASVMPLERADVMAVGFNGFQGKPISVKAFLAEVQAVLQKQAAPSA